MPSSIGSLMVQLCAPSSPSAPLWTRGTATYSTLSASPCARGHTKTSSLETPTTSPTLAATHPSLLAPSLGRTCTQRTGVRVRPRMGLSLLRSTEPSSMPPRPRRSVSSTTKSPPTARWWRWCGIARNSTKPLKKLLRASPTMGATATCTRTATPSRRPTTTLYAGGTTLSERPPRERAQTRAPTESSRPVASPPTWAARFRACRYTL